MSSTKKLTQKCTWACHNNTNHCKENHVKILRPYFEYTDPLYFGVINSLQQTGSYNLANLIVFVLLIPLMMLFLVIRILNMQQEINQANPNR